MIQWSIEAAVEALTLARSKTSSRQRKINLLPTPVISRERALIRDPDLLRRRFAQSRQASIYCDGVPENKPRDEAETGL